MNEITFKDVANLYLGCQCVQSNGEQYELLPSHFPSNWRTVDCHHKPILRSLEDMTADEMREWAIICGREHERILTDMENMMAVYRAGYAKKGMKYFSLENDDFEVAIAFTVFLLSKHFDLFNLIERGHAVRKQV